MPGLPIPNIALQKLVKRDELIIDNLIFRLHHQVTFLLLLVGVVFIVGENYLDVKAIVCSDGDDYSNKFCWLHGTTYVSAELMKALAKTGGRHFDCTGAEEGRTPNQRLSAYYIWLPFLLLAAMLITKLPRNLWKQVLEGGTLRRIMIRSKIEGDLDHRRAAEVYKKLQRDRQRGLMAFTIKLLCCEVLNIIGVILCMVMFDSALNGKFMGYGPNTVSYLQGGALSNPMCEVFPTVVSCTVEKSGITSGIDISNTVCLLSNNLFNMYYFLILWFWYVTVLIISCIALAYRIFVEMAIPAFTEKDPDAKTSWFEIPVKNLLKENLDSLEYDSLQDSLKQYDNDTLLHSDDRLKTDALPY